MKLALLSLLLFCLIGNSFGQSRKNILKEIKNYKHQVCRNTSYQTPIKKIKNLTKAFFKENHYYTFEEDSCSLSFVKKTHLPNNKKVKHFIYVEIDTKNNIKIITTTDKTVTFKEPFAGVEISNVRGAFKLDKKGYYSYLYQNLCGNNINISTELNNKVSSYNIKQTKKEKKLIAGRDY